MKVSWGKSKNSKVWVEMSLYYIYPYESLFGKVKELKSVSRNVFLSHLLLWKSLWESQGTQKWGEMSFYCIYPYESLLGKSRNSKVWVEMSFYCIYPYESLFGIIKELKSVSRNVILLHLPLWKSRNSSEVLASSKRLEKVQGLPLDQTRAESYTVFLDFVSLDHRHRCDYFTIVDEFFCF